MPALAVSLVLFGCGRTALSVDMSVDASVDARVDLGPVDGVRDLGRDLGDIDCSSDVQCADGVFCNGVERCAAGRCVAGAALMCPFDRCADGFGDEASLACARALRDTDRDGFIGIECGGDDCDDTDGMVSPIASEVCFTSADDDCDALADCADTDCAMESMCMSGTCPDRDLGSAFGVASRGATTVASDSTGTCTDSSVASDVAFRWTAPSAGTYAFDTRGSAFDTVLYARAGSCTGAELACDDDNGGSQASLIRSHLAAGDIVLLFVDGFGAGAGAYTLNITLEASTEICGNARDDDRDGLVDCADPDCAGAPECCTAMPEVCGNGNDDDCDSAVDCSDPDCVAAPACCTPAPERCNNGRDDDCDRRVDCGDTECATSPTCCVPAPEDCGNERDDDCDARVDCADSVCVATPICCALRTELCGNIVDDDCDGRADCLDTDCTIDPICMPACPENDLGSMTGAAIAVGSTVGAGNDQTAMCGAGAVGDDVTFGWTAPRSATYVFDIIGSSYDTVLHLRQGDCTGITLVCDDDAGGGVASRITRTIAAGTRLVIIVDGFGTLAGNFVLNVQTLTSEVGNCIDNDGDGTVDCVDPDCASDVACGVPVAEICSDMRDNDCDRVIDCADPNCGTSPSCCTARPETCGNFADDDCDGFIDCVDSDCVGRPPCCLHSSRRCSRIRPREQRSSARTTRGHRSMHR